MPTERESAIKQKAQEVRDHLRDGVCHLNRSNIEVLGSLLEEYGPLHHQVKTLKDETLHILLRAQIMQYSALDHLDSVPTTLRDAVLETGKILHKQIDQDVQTTVRAIHKLNPVQWSLLKHKLAYLLNYANELYRNDRIPESQEVCLRIYEHVALLRNPGTPLEGLLSRTCVQLAKTYRQIMQYDEARRYYNEALETVFRQAELRMKELSSDPERQNKEFRYYRRRSIMILAAGNGYINIASGQMRRAAVILWPLRTMMLLDEDTLSQAFLKMLTASIDRARAGEDQSILDRACGDLENAYKTFEQYDHVRFMRPTLYELVLGLIYSRRFDEARSYTGELRKLLKNRTNIRKTNNPRWEIIAYLLDGIRNKYEGNYEQALKCAEEALLEEIPTNQLARRLPRNSGTQKRRSEIEVNIMAGEALFYLRRYEEAEHKFKYVVGKFVDINKNESAMPDNHLLSAANIYLALIALKNHSQEAQLYYELAVKYPTEHRWVNDLVSRYKELEAKKVTRVEILDFDQPYDVLETEFRNRVMSYWVQKHGENSIQIGKSIKKERRKVMQWLKDYKKYREKDE